MTDIIVIKRTTLVVFSVISVLLIAGIFNRVGSEIYYGHTQDMSIVSIDMKNKNSKIRLKMPKAYLTLSPNWAGWNQSVIDIEADYNTLQPLSVVMKRIDSADALEISISTSLPNVDGISHITHGRWVKVGSIESFTLFVSRRDESYFRNRNRDVEVYYVPTEAGQNNNTYFSCWTTYTGAPGPKCEGVSEYRGFLLGYVFSRKYLDTWKIVDGKVREFLNRAVY